MADNSLVTTASQPSSVPLWLAVVMLLLGVGIAAAVAIARSQRARAQYAEQQRVAAEAKAAIDVRSAEETRDVPDLHDQALADALGDVLRGDDDALAAKLRRAAGGPTGRGGDSP